MVVQMRPGLPGKVEGSENQYGKLRLTLRGLKAPGRSRLGVPVSAGWD